VYETIKKTNWPIEIADFEEAENHLPRVEHADAEVTFSYPTIGMPEPGKPFNTTVVTSNLWGAFDE
jgi:hypothetical protein